MGAKLEVSLYQREGKLETSWRILLPALTDQDRGAELRGVDPCANIQSAYEAARVYADALQLTLQSAWLVNADGGRVGYWDLKTDAFHSVCDSTVEMAALPPDAVPPVAGGNPFHPRGSAQP